MQSIKNTYSAFTLVEVLVTMTIFSIIMVAVMTIFVRTTDISTKSDLQRSLQENVKVVVEKISEDVRVNGIEGVADSTGVSCGYGVNMYTQWDKFCTRISQYYVVKDSGVWFTRVDPRTECQGLEDVCKIAWNSPNQHITNSSVSVINLQFFTSNFEVPKVTMLLTLRPTLKNWARSSLIGESEVTVQTTFTDRQYE